MELVEEGGHGDAALRYSRFSGGGFVSMQKAKLK